MPTPYFEVAHLTKHFSTDESTVAAIQDVSFSLQKGQFLSILGPSGCGKSTLFNLIAGLMQPDCGDIRLQGESMLLRPGLTGYMLQKDLLLPWRTIADNIVLPKTLHGTRRQAALKSAVSDIAACGLRDLLNRRPDECSGGQRQRAALVRTLLTEIATKKRLTILFVTHDVDEALLLSDAILVMGTAPGRILRQYTLDAPRPRTMRVLSQPEFIRVKGEILTLLDKEVTADA